MNSRVDFVNGFIETYTDPLGMKGTWESIVNFKDEEATKRTEIISANAQWFEDNSPVDPQFKKEKVKGVSAKVITAAMLGGDCYPATPIGINLPNSNWIRRDYGSKSVTIENITDAYDKAAEGNGFNEEFMWSEEEIERAKNTVRSPITYTPICTNASDTARGKCCRVFTMAHSKSMSRPLKKHEPTCSVCITLPIPK